MIVVLAHHMFVLKEIVVLTITVFFLLLSLSFSQEEELLIEEKWLVSIDATHMHYPKHITLFADMHNMVYGEHEDMLFLVLLDDVL